MPHASGERHYAAKLTAAKVFELRRLHNTACPCCGQRMTVRALAWRFGVSKATAGHALSGRNWSDLSFGIARRDRDGGSAGAPFRGSTAKQRQPGPERSEGIAQPTSDTAKQERG